MCYLLANWLTYSCPDFRTEKLSPCQFRAQLESDTAYIGNPRWRRAKIKRDRATGLNVTVRTKEKLHLTVLRTNMMATPREISGKLLDVE